MEKRIDEDLVFDNVQATEVSGAHRTFESCKFVNCDFSYADLSQQLFIDCTFQDCNLSLVKVANTGFQDVAFINCKITGVNFSVCRDFSLSFSFSRCILDYAVFYQKKLKNILFEDCSLEEVDFTESDLSKAVFKNCNLNRTVFSRTILKGADFTTAINFSIDPENNSMAKAKFSTDALAGLLEKYDLILK